MPNRCTCWWPEPPPGFPEAILFESGCHGLTGDLGIVARLGFGGREIADGLEEAPVVEPVHPFEGGELHSLGMAPGAAPADHFGLEQADDCLGESIVVAVADAADRRLDAGVGQALGVADRDYCTPRSL